MADFNPILIEVVRPGSLKDSNEDEFEYVLGWNGKNGEPLQQLFTSWENRLRVRTETINLNTPENVRSLINEEERTIQLIAENLTKNQSDVISQTSFSSKQVFRIFKDGTKEPVAILDNSFKSIQTNKRFKVEIQIRLFNNPLPN